MSKKLYAGYLRISSKSQETNSSIQNQIDTIKSYAKTNNIKVDLFQDIASGKNTERANFNIMMNNINNYAGVICLKLDRISRDLIDTLTIKKQLDSMGKELIVIGDSMNKDTSRLELTIRALISDEERITINKRMLDGKKKKKEQGLYTGGNIPAGLKINEVKSNNKIIGKELIIDPAMIDIIKEIKANKRAGKTYYEISQYLKNKGYKTVKGSDYTYKSVKTICDLYVIKNGDVVKK